MLTTMQYHIWIFCIRIHTTYYVYTYIDKPKYQIMVKTQLSREPDWNLFSTLCRWSEDLQSRNHDAARRVVFFEGALKWGSFCAFCWRQKHEEKHVFFLPSWPDAAQQWQHVWREGWPDADRLPHSFLFTANGRIVELPQNVDVTIDLVPRCHNDNAKCLWLCSGCPVYSFLLLYLSLFCYTWKGVGARGFRQK